jgi:hypothetical protein
MSMGERALATPEADNTITVSNPNTTERHVLLKLNFKNIADFLSLSSLT